jgi:hypothetical protein
VLACSSRAPQAEACARETLHAMSETESAKPRIAETFIAAYYLSIFFQFTLNGLTTAARQWRFLLRGPNIALMGLGIVCLVVGISLLLQRNWAKTVAVFLSGIIVLITLTPLLVSVAPRGSSIFPRVFYPWPLLGVHMVINAAVVWFLARA